MSSRRKHSDTRRASGRSKIRPVEGESWKERHDRRLRHNLRLLTQVFKWASDHSIAFQVNNNGHHWIFRSFERIAEWWPSSAKLVFDKNWEDGIHTHDFTQLKAEIEREWFGEGEAVGV